MYNMGPVFAALLIVMQQGHKPDFKPVKLHPAQQQLFVIHKNENKLPTGIWQVDQSLLTCINTRL